VWKTIKNAALPEVVVVGRSSIDSLCEEKNQYEKIYFPFQHTFFVEQFTMHEWKKLVTPFQVSLFFVIFNKFFAFLFILTASPLLNYSITNLHNNEKRAKEKEFFHFFHFPLHTDLSCAAKKYKSRVASRDDSSSFIYEKFTQNLRVKKSF